MKPIVWIVALGAIAAAASVLVRRCAEVDESERAGTGAPTERAVPQARAS